jgi:hypothetical protein
MVLLDAFVQGMRGRCSVDMASMPTSLALKVGCLPLNVFNVELSSIGGDGIICKDSTAQLLNAATLIQGIFFSDDSTRCKRTGHDLV